MGFFYRPLAVLIVEPWLGLVPAALLVALYAWSRRPVVLIAGAAWLLYVPYEYGMKLRLLCSGECNIHVDLLVLYPALVIVAAWAVVAALRAR